MAASNKSGGAGNSDNAGRPYATLDQLQIGTRLQVGDGFHCLQSGAIVVVQLDNEGYFWVPCGAGRHRLSGPTHPTTLTGFYFVGDTTE